MSRSAPWITVEGVDGAGKSSHIDAIVAHLRDAGFTATATREPGGTPLGERLRTEILNTPMAVTTEILLAFASRAEHLDKVIRPALNAGSAVVCDRFTDSTYAYQGAGQGGSLSEIEQLERLVHPGEQPDLTLVFDLPVEESLRRLDLTGKTPDKFESQGAEYFSRVRAGYHARQAADPNRIVLIDSTPALDEVKEHVAVAVQEFLARWDMQARIQVPGARRPRRPGA